MTTYTPERYSPSDWPQVATLLSAWPLKSLRGHAHWSDDGLTALCLARAENTLWDPHVTAWIAKAAGELVGFTALRTLPWDSEQIGLSAARIAYLVAEGSSGEQRQIKQVLLDAALQNSLESGLEHLSVRLDASDTSGLHVLEQLGFITVDSILTFSRNLDGSPFPFANEDISIRLATPADSERTAKLAHEAYMYDRFHSDSAIPTERANELHAAWLRNSCTGVASDAVVLAEDKRDLLGYVTCKLQHDTKVHLQKLVGTIVLVATAKQARRRGVARAATLAALNWFHQQGADIVDVGSQVGNIPACRLYESCGFRLVGASISLRKSFGEASADRTR